MQQEDRAKPQGLEQINRPCCQIRLGSSSCSSGCTSGAVYTPREQMALSQGAAWAESGIGVGGGACVGLEGGSCLCSSSFSPRAGPQSF